MISFASSFKFASNRFVKLNVIRSFASSGGSTAISRCIKSITDLLKPVRVNVTSTNDDPNGSHVRIECISEAFEGKTTLQRQKLVYKAIWDELNGEVHAVDSIIAKTPKEAGL